MNEMKDKFDIDDDDIRIISRKNLFKEFPEPLDESESPRHQLRACCCDDDSLFYESGSRKESNPSRRSKILFKMPRLSFSSIKLNKAQRITEAEDVELCETTSYSENETSCIPTETLADGYVDIFKRSAFGGDMTVLTPRKAIPSLEFGQDFLTDPSVIFALPAFDIGVEKELEGAAIVSGRLLGAASKDAGFCSIIDGQVEISMGGWSGRFEEAMRKRGDFFRQRPLVFNRYAIFNRTQGREVRRALAMMGGRLSVISSCEKMTLEDFAKELMDMNVTDAICLSSTKNDFLFYVDKTGERFEVGERKEVDSKVTAYLVWSLE